MATSVALGDLRSGPGYAAQAPGCRHDLAEPAVLAGIGVTLTVGPGQTIVIEGDPIRHYFRIVSGTVRLYKAIADGRRQVIDFLGAGTCFGLTGTERHSYSAEAISPATLIRYPRQALETAICRDAGLARALFRMASAELDRAQQQMLLLGRKSAEEKVASFLLSLAADREDARSGRRMMLHLAMSRQDMADYLGLTIETVSRTLSRFRRLGLIDLAGRHTVMLRRVDRLQALADGLAGDAAEPCPFGRRAGPGDRDASVAGAARRWS